MSAKVIPWPKAKPDRRGEARLFADIDSLPVADLAPAALRCLLAFAEQAQRVEQRPEARTEAKEHCRRLLTTVGAAAIRLLDLIDAETEDREPEDSA